MKKVVSSDGWWASLSRLLKSEWEKLTYVPNEAALRSCNQRQYPMRPISSPNSTLADKLIDFWSREGWKGNSPASIEAIEAFEKKYGAQLPQAIREYFLQVNGTGNDWRDDQGINYFLSVEEMASREEWCSCPRLKDGPVDIVFIDHFYWASGFTFRLGEENPSIWSDDYGCPDQATDSTHSPGRRMVAVDFADFVAKYLRKEFLVF